MANYTTGKWDLSDLASDNELTPRIEEIKSQVKEFVKYQEILDENISAEKVTQIIKHEEAISEKLHLIAGYTHLKFTENTSDQTAIKNMQIVENLATEISNQTMFFSLWFKKLNDKTAHRIINEVTNPDYKYVLKRARITKDYVLSEKEEKIINVKDTTGTDAIQSMYDITCNQFTFKIEIDGKPHDLTFSELSKYFKSPNPKLREKAYKELLRVYSENGLLLGEMYKNIASDWVKENLDLRGYNNEIAPRNIGNEISDEAVEALLESCKKNRKIFWKYFKLKARALSMDKMSRYHVYAPLSSDEKNITYDYAVKTVLEVFDNFSENFGKGARQIINKNHVDSELRKSKRSGAFCCFPSPHVTPYVLLNFDGKKRDVSTLAHELGHGIHAILANNRPISTFDPGLPLAETASIFSEMLLSEKLMQDETSVENKKAMAAETLDDMFATILRQSYFVFFERKMHQSIKNGITLDEARDIYMNMLKEQFGPDFEIPDEFKNEWLYVPHIFHSPFYCYAYAFGKLLVLALYEIYKEQGQKFVPKLEKILAYGGSKEPENVLAEIDIDIQSTEFWDKGFNLIQGHVEEFEKLLD